MAGLGPSALMTKCNELSWSWIRGTSLTTLAVGVRTPGLGPWSTILNRHFVAAVSSLLLLASAGWSMAAASQYADPRGLVLQAKALPGKFTVSQESYVYSAAPKQVKQHGLVRAYERLFSASVNQPVIAVGSFVAIFRTNSGALMVAELSTVSAHNPQRVGLSV